MTSTDLNAADRTLAPQSVRLPLPLGAPPFDTDVLSVTQLRAAGLGEREVARLARGGRLTPLTRGWYAARSPNDAVDRHRLTAASLAQAYAGVAVPSHYSELARLGLPLLRADLATVHLTRIGSDYSRRRPGLVVHRQLPGALHAGRIRPEVAIVQAGMVAGPLAALVAADAALHRRLVTRDDLDGAVALVRGHPRTGLIGPFLRLADPRCESPGETRLRHLFHLMGLPVHSQVRIEADGRLAIVDFLVDEAPVVVEFDGLVKYDPARQQDAWAVLVREKDREDWIRGLGFEVERVVWRELDAARPLARRMARALARARSRPAPPAWTAALREARNRDPAEGRPQL